mmetsp:Transcript_2857/g.5349  ORF Transcript_2857/g.5349 Transcript_2857/m.5349 type:complete len:468 (-) Transcript_2857:177-1580(-)
MTIPTSQGSGTASYTIRRPPRRRFDRVNSPSSDHLLLQEEQDVSSPSPSSNAMSGAPDTETNSLTRQSTNTIGTADDDDNHIIVSILDSAQNKFEINVPPDSTVLDLKVRGQEVHSIPPEKQRLICMGQLLQDGKRIRDHNIVNGSIIHLFPKPNVVITESPSPNGTNNSNSNQDTPGSPSPLSPNALTSPSGGRAAHVPQIIMNSEEINRQSSILILSTHEAYETMHRIRLLSFLLLMYASLQMLRDISIYFTPTTNYGHDVIIPPGDPIDTGLPGGAGNEYNDQLPQWQDRDYIEMAISALAIYVALLGMKSTSEQIRMYLARRFVILLAILGISWNAYLYSCYVDQLKARESKEDYESGKVFQDALFAVALPFLLWAMFFLRAIQFYALVNEAEMDAAQRSRTLASAIVYNYGGGSDGGDDEQQRQQQQQVGGSGGGGDANEGSGGQQDEGYDLELQRSVRNIT